MLLMGVRDDTRGLSPLFKMALQLIATLLAVFFGVRLEGIGVWAVPTTLLCLLLLTNAYNLVDGLDGLCAGCSGIGGGAFALLGLASGDPTITALGLSVLGGCLGFLPYNFRRPKLFLGDTGAQLIGFCLGLMTVRSINTGRTVTALCIVAYPLAEILATVLRRLRRGQSPLAADRGHFHHRLIDRGLSHGRATVLLLLPSLFLSMVGLLLPLATPASEAVLLLSIPGITLCWRMEGKRS